MVFREKDRLVVPVEMLVVVVDIHTLVVMVAMVVQQEDKLILAFNILVLVAVVE